MPLQVPIEPAGPPCVALVDGDPIIRRARQLTLRSEGYEVRSYAACAALLTDPLALKSVCVIADVVMTGITGPELLDAMRDAGWAGCAILLADGDRWRLADAANDHNIQITFPTRLSGRPLLEAVRNAIKENGNR